VDGFRRRQVLLSMALLPAATPALAQAPATPPVFGVLLAFSVDTGRIFTRPLRAYMEALGYVDGRNVAFDVQYADGKVERLPALASELVARRPTVIATFGDAAGLAAKAATSEIPIVAMSEDLIGAHLVNSMAHPGANITGVSVLGTELDAKRLQLLSELLPARSSILLLADATTHRSSRRALESTAQTLGLTLREAVVNRPDDIDHALREAKQGGVVGVNVLSSAFLFALRERIIARAAEGSLATIFQWPETADEGGLLAYGPSLLGAFRMVIALVSKILQGARPVDIPVEQPTKFEFVVNLRTARALGITIPRATMLYADRTIE
jgi:putative tryptophan/tyrosine transport system substrate-binding protein